MSLIKPDDAWLLWAFLVGWAAISIWLEQKYTWASKITGAIIALLGALILANLNIIPKESPTYDAVWGYIVPIAIPLLLFNADIKKIWTESGKMLGIFHISAVGTCLGAFIAAFALQAFIPETYKIAGMMTGSYVGGGVNFVAMTAAFKTSENMVNATIVADNLVMAVYFFVLMTIPTLLFFKKNFKTAAAESAATAEDGETQASSYWGRKDISLKDIALAMGVAVAVAAVSKKLAILLGGTIPDSNFLLGMLKTMLGNQYLIMTTLMLILASVFSKFFSSINGAQELGTFLIYIFFVVIGVPASIKEIIVNSPMLFVFCIIMVAVNLLITLSFGKLFKFNLEEMLLASNANIGGPTTAAAMAIAKGWNKLVIPTILSGIWGYVIGNYLGILVGNTLMKLLG